MTLVEYIKHLVDIDRRVDCAGLFNCNVKQTGPNKFYYEFNALLDCDTEFLEDGTVRETVDGYTSDYSSIAEWKNKLVEQLTENYCE